MWFPIPIPPFVKQILFKSFAHFLLCCFLKIDFWKFLKYLDVSSLFSHRMELVFSFCQWCLLKSRRCSFVGWSGHPLVVSEWHKDSSKHLKKKKLLEAISQHLWRTYSVSGANNLLGTKNWCWGLKAYYLPKTKNLLHIGEWEPTVFQELRTYSCPRTKNLLCIGEWKPTVCQGCMTPKRKRNEIQYLISVISRGEGNGDSWTMTTLSTLSEKSRG